jgi:uncharacterized protein (DUF952 family)
VTELIYHITSRISWAAAQKSGAYSADSLTGAGFIHCSKANQIVRVANIFFTNQHGLAILVINPLKLKSEVRWEVGTDKANELFPHIYGPLNVEAVMRVLDFEPGPDGMFSIPVDLK